LSEEKNTWKGINKKVELSSLDFYIICADNEDGSLHRITIVGPRTNADFGAFAEGISELVNLCLLYNIPLVEITRRLKYIKGETAGLTNSQTIHTASSVIDFVGRFLEERYETR
jgi:hypothetical protein